MLGKKTENPRPVSLAKVKDLLSARAAEPDFGYEQQLSLDYAKKFCKLAPGDAESLEAGLSKIGSLHPETVVKIVDILPEHASTLQAVCAKEKIVLSEKEADEVLALVREARKSMIEEPPPAPAPAEGAVEGEAPVAEKDAAPGGAAEPPAAEPEPKKPAKEEKKPRKKSEDAPAPADKDESKPHRKKKESKA